MFTMLGRKILSSVLSFYLFLSAVILILSFAALPFFPDAFSAVSRFACESYFVKSAAWLAAALMAIHLILELSVKLENLIKSSQQNPDIKFNGQAPVLSFCLPFAEIIFCTCLYAYIYFLISFDFTEKGTDYAQTLIELLRAKRIALIWLTGFLSLSFIFGRGLPDALHCLGFSTSREKSSIRYLWRGLVILCLSVSLLSIYYCTETDLLLNIQEEPMVIIK